MSVCAHRPEPAGLLIPCASMFTVDGKKVCLCALEVQDRESAENLARSLRDSGCEVDMWIGEQ